MDITQYLGENSYPCVVSKITEKIKNANADTVEGNNYLSKVYSELVASDTPMLCVRQLISNPEITDDACLNDVIDYCKELAVNNTDYNYLINLCREEHIAKLKEIGITEPAKTIEIDEVNFNEPSDVVKSSILNGVYNDLKYSVLLNTLKKSFGMVNEDKIDINDLTGKQYRFAVSELTAFIENYGPTDTIQGTNLVNGVANILNKTKTPLLVIRDFIVEGLKVSKTYHDERLEKFISEIQTMTNATGLNYLINLCREEEIRNKEITAHNVPNELYTVIDDEDSLIKQDIIDGIYDHYNSKLLIEIKKSFGINPVDDKVETASLKNFLGEKSYISIKDSIIERLRNAEVGTIAGNDMISKLYKKLNESITPMLDVKEFVTNAQEVAKDDAKLLDVLEFCKKQATTGDLNYIINLCKEEHFANLLRSGHPEPEKTIEEIKKHFNSPSSIVEQAIQKGIFDRLNSKLLNEIKTGLNIQVEDRGEQIKKLDESYQYANGGYARYCPIGVLFEDTNNNRIIALCENDALSFDKEKQEYSKLSESINLPHDYKRMMTAIHSLRYNPESEKFSLNENWDFIAEINNDGKCFVGLNENSMKEIVPSDMKKLLLESVQEYRKKNGSNCDEFVRDADNFIMLLENYDNIVKFDNLSVVRSLNEGNYVMFDMHDVRATNVPKILSINGTKEKTFESFIALCESVKDIVGKDCLVQMLFESEIKAEHEQLNERREKISSLMENQKSLNEQIQKVKNLKSLAENGSPAMDKLNEQHNILLSKLNENIATLNFYNNEFKLH